ncbi:MAG: Lrp/AsnC family transcriptional regulator [Methanocalculus sp. MSAO_Arc1]|uniref:siroheme decarboxylase subunit alpha n=1 Tax=Methanocalculus TaxID=71151 RepID=UPI000FF8436F|nr:MULTISPECIES: AsnC family transcriptional regulator [unclassified Methanocalculus]MCP1662159.1 DNA-binding Lrp family transcriptional regulator [Methanocalculus sp. AMF5]RQD79110.1 MAG: Lrp/AsnC family transcriptional regulator [Methanocalculus sp. MSAO_Arc1]
MTDGETPEKEIDYVDRLLLDALQEDLPLVENPWQAVGEMAGISGDECIERLSRLKEAGILRNISPILDSRTFGLKAGSLVAVHVPEEEILRVTRIINSYRSVSHNYRRDHHYNIWFTLAGKTDEEINRTCEEIKRRAGIPAEDMIALPTIRAYKIDVRFSCTTTSEDEHGSD